MEDKDMNAKTSTEQDTTKIAKRLGRLGGMATVEKYGSEHMKRISKLGAQKRWGEKKKIKKEARP